MSDEPDFQQLARETLWPAEEWRAAWNSLSEPRLWPTVVDMTNNVGTRPTDAANMLECALEVEVRRS